LSMPKGKRVEVFFKDVALPTTRTAMTYAYTYVSLAYGSTMDFSLPAVLGNRQNVRWLFQHELTHGVQECWLGNGPYGALPTWLKEGLATYVGGHGPERVAKFRRFPNV